MNREDFLNFIKDLGFEYNSLHKSFTIGGLYQQLTDLKEQNGSADLNGYVYRKCVKISTFDDFANVSLGEINKMFMSGDNLFRVNYIDFNEESKIEFIKHISKYFRDEDRFKSFLRNDKLNKIL